jgi:hypothetical protein
VFDFSWDSPSKTLHVKSPWTGRYLCRVPGTCGPRREFWQACGFLVLSGAPAVFKTYFLFFDDLDYVYFGSGLTAVCLHGGHKEKGKMN